jgi:hypothetical protein
MLFQDLEGVARMSPMESDGAVAPGFQAVQREPDKVFNMGPGITPRNEGTGGHKTKT